MALGKMASQGGKKDHRGAALHKLINHDVLEGKDQWLPRLFLASTRPPRTYSQIPCVTAS